MVSKPPSLGDTALAALTESVRCLREEQGLPALEPEPPPQEWLTTEEYLKTNAPGLMVKPVL